MHFGPHGTQIAETMTVRPWTAEQQMHLGDVAVDLSIAHTFLPPSAHDRFRRAYGEIDDATWRLARFRALQYGTYLAQYAHSVGDANLLREALLTLAWLR